MAEYIAITEQTVNPGESVIFTITTVPCNRGLVRHQDGTGSFLLRGVGNNSFSCCCGRNATSNYNVDFDANIAIPTGGTVETISLALAIDGATIPASEMDSSPSAVELYNHVGRDITAPVWLGCCQTVSVRNITDQPILVKDAVIRFSR